jgi:small-conductance mechanosensitive channel
LATVATLIALWITLTLFMAILGAMGLENGLLSAGRSLLAAAIFIRLVTLVIRSPFWSKVAFYVAWPIAALDAFGVLDNVVRQLENASVQLAPPEGDRAAVTLSMLDVVRAGIIFVIFFWLASIASSLINRQIQGVEELNPSFKALLSKVLNFVMPIVALVLALQMINFNLASLAVFSGAVGLGIGLGLQKVIGNFLAGFTLLADQSIKPGDVIEVDDVFGWVTEMKSRYVAIRTRDGHHHLVPNATFIDNGVVNWSHDDRAVRIHAPFGVTYKQRDLGLVQELAINAAKSTQRVLERPAPVCNLVGFGDSSVDFDLRFWINDPPNGIANVRSNVLLKIWDALHEHDIEIPFPQRDLHIRSSDVSLADLREPERSNS